MPYQASCFIEKPLTCTVRLRVLDMYRAAIDTNIAGGPLAEEPPPHRYLFQSYVYQYHLIIFSTHLVTMVSL